MCSRAERISEELEIINSVFYPSLDGKTSRPSNKWRVQADRENIGRAGNDLRRTVTYQSTVTSVDDGQTRTGGGA